MILRSIVNRDPGLDGQIFQRNILHYACTIWYRRTTLGERHTCISRGSATAPPQGTETQHCPFWGVPFYLCIQPLTQNDEIWCGKIFGKRLVLGVQPCCRPRERSPSSLQFLQFSSIYAYAL